MTIRYFGSELVRYAPARPQIVSLIYVNRDAIGGVRVIYVWPENARNIR